MPKVLTVAALAASGLILLLFLLDLAVGFPFGRAMMMDICFIIGAGALGYLSWITFKDMK